MTHVENKFLNDRYRLLQKREEFTNFPVPAPFFPNVDDLDYKAGYFTRYFAKKRNDRNSIITEIEKSNYDSLQTSDFYKTVYIRWKIAGPMRNVIINNVIDEEGILEYNRQQVRTNEHKMPGLSKKITDYLAFWRGY